MLSIKLYQVRVRPRKDGTCPIYFVLSEGSERRFISTKVYLAPHHFDNDTGQVLRGAQNMGKLNSYFQIQLGRIHDIVMELENKGLEATFERIEAKFNNKSGDDFITFALEELEKERSIIEFKTYQGYKNRLENLRKYKATIAFNELNHSFLISLKRHFALKGRKPNGYYQDFAAIKKFHRLAVIKGLASGNPFEQFTMEKEETVKSWLNREELIALESLIGTDKITGAEKNTLRHFLFSCYSGIRFGDKQVFNETNVVDGRIHLRQRKTSKHVTIPFSEQAERLLPDILERPLKQSNSRVNTDLETCMEQAGINKKITYHCSRHTFAINCILAGIDIITVRDWLGHKSVTTTEIYAKIAASYKDASVLKLDHFLTGNKEQTEMKPVSRIVVVKKKEKPVKPKSQLDEVLEMKAQGITNVAIARHFNVSETAVRKWLKK